MNAVITFGGNGRELKCETVYVNNTLFVFLKLRKVLILENRIIKKKKKKI